MLVARLAYSRIPGAQLRPGRFSPSKCAHTRTNEKARGRQRQALDAFTSTHATRVTRPVRSSEAGLRGAKFAPTGWGRNIDEPGEAVVRHQRHHETSRDDHEASSPMTFVAAYSLRVWKANKSASRIRRLGIKRTVS